MFQRDKTISALNIPACKVVHLFRSMREVQLALPGVSAQQASAFLCQYHVEGGIGTVAIFHLHKSQILAFYPSDPRVVPEQKTDGMLDQALNFVESMGFLMTDQDIDLLDEAGREVLWESLPIKTGLSGEKELLSVAVTATATEDKPAAKVAAIKVETVQEEQQEPVASAAGTRGSQGEVPAVEPGQAAPKAEPRTETSENVDELLAAVEAMRTKHPGLRSRKSPPSAEEMGRRRLLLRETLGRILASL